MRQPENEKEAWAQWLCFGPLMGAIFGGLGMAVLGTIVGLFRWAGALRPDDQKIRELVERHRAGRYLHPAQPAARRLVERSHAMCDARAPVTRARAGAR